MKGERSEEIERREREGDGVGRERDTKIRNLCNAGFKLDFRCFDFTKSR